MDFEVQHAYRLAQLERRVEAIMRHLGIQDLGPDTTASPRVVELARTGDKIGAIKLYREETGCDLATAKNVVEQLF
jgi:ribosomal protein L7/L12